MSSAPLTSVAGAKVVSIRSRCGVPVAVADNGVHVDIVVPTVFDDVDWRAVLPSGATVAERTWVGFGWGAREFYMNTPTWADLRFWPALKALLGVGGSTVRVHGRDRPPVGGHVKWLEVGIEEYRAIAAGIRAAMRLDTAGRAVAIRAAGFGGDAFLEARGRYSPILTCNEWASRVLARAGVRTAFWSPFPNGVALPRQGE